MIIKHRSGRYKVYIFIYILSSMNPLYLRKKRFLEIFVKKEENHEILS